DGYMTSVRDRVDRLAYAVNTQVNAQHAQGYGLAGSVPSTGVDFFTPPPPSTPSFPRRTPRGTSMLPRTSAPISG
ncbi:MAG: hypothetical protein ACXWWT_07345, partial [Candidatus Deferrimicrobiaceae bacterium]